MTFYVGKRGIKVEGYDEYIKSFEEKVLPEFRKEAESLLQNEIAKAVVERYGRFSIFMYKEKTKDDRSWLFEFSVCGRDDMFVTYDGCWS